MKIDPREEKLPKWAQETLSTLRRELERSAIRNAELRGEVGETNTVVTNYGEFDQPLRNNARVQFNFPGERWDNYIQAYVEGNRLRIQGGRYVVIHPNVSNAFWIELGDR